MRTRFSFAALIGLLLLCDFTTQARRISAPPGADTIIVNAKIYTVNPAQPWAEALAIRGENILAVGETQQIMRYRRAPTRIIDLKGHMVLPGFVDSHIHFMDGSLSLTRIDLTDTKNVSEIQKVVSEFAAAHPHDAWLLGRGWSYPEFGAAALPHKKYLDEIIPDRPVFLEGFDGHTYWANSKALQIAGITKNTPDPANGMIVRDPLTGEPTGALKESAAELVARIIPQPTRDQRLAALRLGMTAANRAGLTRIHSCGGDFEYLNLFDQLRREGRLTLRIYMSYFQDPPELTSRDLTRIERARRRYHDDWISGGAVKMMLDGVIETHTAAMLTPYADDPSLLGKLFWDPVKYRQAVTTLDRGGLQIFTHAIGDRAVRLALDAYEAARQKNRTVDARHRIEHIETIAAQDIPRFGSIGVIASFQPLHAIPDDDTLLVWLKNVGHEREPRAWAWQSIVRSGGRLAFGSDWPVVTLNPWEGIQNGVTRQTLEGKPEGGWVPAERISLAQAIEGYTRGAAIGGHREKTEGSIEPGKLADLIVVSQNLFDVDPHAIARTEVLLTMLGGKEVYKSSQFAERSRESRVEVAQ